jgi:hypothetical protein
MYVWTKDKPETGIASFSPATIAASLLPPFWLLSSAVLGLSSEFLGDVAVGEKEISIENHAS